MGQSYLEDISPCQRLLRVCLADLTCEVPVCGEDYVQLDCAPD